MRLYVRDWNKNYFLTVFTHKCMFLMGYAIFFFPTSAAAAAAKLLQSCPTLCEPTDGSPPGSPIPGILQARTLEWGAISFFKAWKWKVQVKSLSHVQLFATPWTAAYQAPLSMGFSRQEYWSGVPLPSLRLGYCEAIMLIILGYHKTISAALFSMHKLLYL